MNLKFCIKVLGCLILTTKVFASSNKYTGECDTIAKKFAAYNGGSYDDVYNCANNENGKVKYIMIGKKKGKKSIRQYYLDEVSKLTELNDLCLSVFVSDDLNYDPLKKLKKLEELSVDAYTVNPLTKIPDAFYSLTSLKRL